MTAGEARFIYWAFLLLGATLLFSGWRAIHRRRTRAEGQEYEGRAAARLGWLWIVLGILLIAAALFKIGILMSFGQLFLESSS